MRVGTGTLRFDVAEPWTLQADDLPPEVPGVAVNSKGEVHVLTRKPYAVQVFDRSGRPLRTWGAGTFTSTHGIHIGPDDAVYVVDAGDSTVRKFSPDGELLLQLGNPGSPSETGYSGDYTSISIGGPPFNACTNVAVAPSNDIYVSDGYGNARVHRFSESGELVGSWGEPGEGPGQFNVPHGIFVDRRGTVLVADRENSRIQRFTPDGTYIDEWTDVRRPDTLFVTDDDLVYVAELGFIGGLFASMPPPTRESPPSRITIRDQQGAIVSTLGNDDPDDLCAAGNFFAAHGIWVDPEGSVYVGEVISATGPRREGDFGWVPRSCHALQVFHRAS